MKRFIIRAEQVYMLAVWLTLALLLIPVMVLNLFAMLIDKGTEAVTVWAADIQATAVSKLKE